MGAEGVDLRTPSGCLPKSLGQQRQFRPKASTDHKDTLQAAHRLKRHSKQGQASHARVKGWIRKEWAAIDGVALQSPHQAGQESEFFDG